MKFKKGKGAWFEHNGWTYIAEGRCKDAQGATYIVDHLGEKHLESECVWNTIDYGDDETYHPDLDQEEINVVLSMAACCTWEDIELFEAMPKNQWQQVWDRMPQSSRKRVHEQKRIRDKHQASQPVEAEAC